MTPDVAVVVLKAYFAIGMLLIGVPIVVSPRYVVRAVRRSMATPIDPEVDTPLWWTVGAVITMAVWPLMLLVKVKR